MAKGVLGNDPFRQGAATRESPDTQRPAKASKREVQSSTRATKKAEAPGKARPAAAATKAPVKPKRAPSAPTRMTAENGTRSATEAPVTEPVEVVHFARSAPVQPEEVHSMAGGKTRARPSAGDRGRSRGEGARVRPEQEQEQEHPQAQAQAQGDGVPAKAKARATPKAPPPELHALPAAPHPGEAPPDPAAAPVSPPSSVPSSVAPQLVLVGAQDTREVEPQAPALDHELEAGSAGLRQRSSQAAAFAWQLASAGLQGPAVVDTLRVGRGLARAMLGAIGFRGSRDVDDYGRDATLVSDLSPLTELLYTRYWRVAVQGAVHVPTGPVLLVANHSGAVPYDGPVLHQALARERPDLAQSRWLIEDQIFHAPFFGTFFNRLGALRACPENALRLLDERRPVAVFPEGVQGLAKPFRERYQLKRFGRGGFVKIALRAGVPIVPVAIVGAEEATPLIARLPGSILGLGYVPLTPLGPVPLPARWMIRFGEPLDLEGLGPEGADDLSAVQRLTERTRESIQGMLQSLLRERRGVFSG